jgi:membrane-associated PAP2 superfamily phosphatase
LCFFGFPGLGGESLDIWFQNLFWRQDHWLIPHEAWWGIAFAYKGPKACLIVFALFLVVIAIRPQPYYPWMTRRRAIYLLLCLALVPAICSQLRTVTHMSTPLDLKMYGGTFEHLLLFQAKPSAYPSNAFPAAHASGGFSLLGLIWASSDPKDRRAGLVISLAAGVWMGGYQIARGEHFLSHTIVTMVLAWVITLVLARWLKPESQETSA